MSFGSHGARALARRGHDVVIYDNLSTGHRELAQGFEVEGHVGDASTLGRARRGADGERKQYPRSCCAASTWKSGLAQLLDGSRKPDSSPQIPILPFGEQHTLLPCSPAKHEQPSTPPE